MLAIVNEAPNCLTPQDCRGDQQCHLLIDVRTPSAPRLLAERWVPGAVTNTYRRAGTLYIVSRVLYPCDPNSLEHLRLGPDGFQRLPSIDLTGLLSTLPRTWQLYARESRVYTISGQEFARIDTRSETPTITQRTLPTWCCPALDVRGDIAYCARANAGLEAIDLTVK